jgi:hypothetical protein
LTLDEPKSIVETALTESSRVLPLETPPVQVSTSTSDPAPNDTKEAVSRIEILDECLVAEICIDRYLWALYQRTPKEDTIKVEERRKVTVKKRAKRSLSPRALPVSSMRISRGKIQRPRKRRACE